MELYEAMRTTFACREFTGEPVSDSVLGTILENARFAPSGGNRQGGHIIAVRNAETKAALARLAEPVQPSGLTIIVVAAVGVVINTLTAMLFHRGKDNDLNIRGAYLHMAADAAVSLGVVVSGASIGDGVSGAGSTLVGAVGPWGSVSGPPSQATAPMTPTVSTKAAAAISQR